MGEFHQARRGSGQGDMHWQPMKEDAVWELFVESLWDFQYTREETKLTPQLSHTLYEVSQGIIDIAVKAYMLAQRRAIKIAMTTPSAKEIIDENIILSVAQDSITLSNYVLSAMKNGKLYELIDVEDIHPNKIGTLIQGTFQGSATGSQGKSKTSSAAKGKSSQQEQQGTDHSTGTKQGSAQELDVSLLKGGLIEVTLSATKGKFLWYDALNEAGYIMSISEYNEAHLLERVVG